jgi:hypothetical protein
MVQVRDQAQVSGPRTSDGIVIITAQRASGPHPHPAQGGRIVPFNYVTHLLLANGEERFRCDYPTPSGPNPTCGKDTFTQVKSVPAHMSSHTADRTGPRYPEETLRTLIRLVRTYQRAGHTDYVQRAAAQLNRDGRYLPLDGGEWTAERVKRLFHRHHADFRTHVRQVQVDRVQREQLTGTTPTPATQLTHPEDPEMTATATATAPAKTADAATTAADRRTLAALDQRLTKLTADAAKLNDACRTHTENLADFAVDVAEAVRALAARPDADPEVVQKARRWDTWVEMQKMLTD